jgi:hypothetical protein
VQTTLPGPSRGARCERWPLPARGRCLAPTQPTSSAPAVCMDLGRAPMTESCIDRTANLQRGCRDRIVALDVDGLLRPSGSGASPRLPASTAARARWTGCARRVVGRCPQRGPPARFRPARPNTGFSSGGPLLFVRREGRTASECRSSTWPRRSARAHPVAAKSLDRKSPSGSPPGRPDQGTARCE